MTLPGTRVCIVIGTLTNSRGLCILFYVKQRLGHHKYSVIGTLYTNLFEITRGIKMPKRKMTIHPGVACALNIRRFTENNALGKVAQIRTSSGMSPWKKHK